MSGINKAYHKKKRVRIGGRILHGFDPKAVKELEKAGKAKALKPTRKEIAEVIEDLIGFSYTLGFAVATQRSDTQAVREKRDAKLALLQEHIDKLL